MLKGRRPDKRPSKLQSNQQQSYEVRRARNITKFRTSSRKPIHKARSRATNIVEIRPGQQNAVTTSSIKPRPFLSSASTNYTDIAEMDGVDFDSLNEIAPPQQRPTRKPRINYGEKFKSLTSAIKVKATNLPIPSLIDIQTITRSPKLVTSLSAVILVAGLGIATHGFLLNRQLQTQLGEIKGATDSLQSSTDSEGNVVETQVSRANIPDESPPPVNRLETHTVPASQPRVVSIPKLGTKAIVGAVGLTDAGAVDTPTNIYDTGWFNGSAQATDGDGAMFLVGHYSGPTRKGVFAGIDSLSAGDEIEIEKGDGEMQKYKVTEVINFPVDDVDMRKALTSSDPTKLGLNLMTCGGSFDVDSWQYQERTLVRSVLVN